MRATQCALATACSVLVAALAWGDPPPGKGHGKGPDRDDHADLGPGGPGKGPKGKKGPGPRTAFLPAERDRIWSYYHPEHGPGPGPGGPGGMPPGWQKQLARNGHLPPGIEKKLQPLPPPLIAELPPIPVGYTRYRVDTRVLLVQDATRLVLDIIDLTAR